MGRRQLSPVIALFILLTLLYFTLWTNEEVESDDVGRVHSSSVHLPHVHLLPHEHTGNGDHVHDPPRAMKQDVLRGNKYLASVPTPASAAAVDNDAEYRDMLIRIHPLDKLPHSKTLGVASSIYVIGLPGREDRRRAMKSLERAMDLAFTYHNATDQNAPIIKEVIERIHIARSEARKGFKNDNAHNYPFFFPYLETPVQPLTSASIDGAELWILDPTDPRWSQLPKLSAGNDDDTGEGTSVTDRRPMEYVAIDFGKPNPDWPLKRSEVACWKSHFEVIQKIAHSQDNHSVAIILEDDVDLEWELEKRLLNTFQHLPSQSTSGAEWDMVMLGHCQSNEASQPAISGTSYIHPTTHTMCTHAYAISHTGATKLLRYLREPLFFASRPIDHAYIFLNNKGLIKSFSLYPPVVVQSKKTLSDVSAGTGPQEEFTLMDSTLERVRLGEEELERRKKV